MKKVNTEAALKNMEGNAITYVIQHDDERPDEVKELTLKTVMVNAILHPEDPDQKLTGEQKLDRFLLAQKIQGAAEVELNESEIRMIKSLVNKVYPTLYVGRVFTMLDESPGIG